MTARALLARAIALLAALMALGAPASAQYASSAGPDPFYLQPFPPIPYGLVKRPVGVTPRAAQTLNAGLRNLVIIGAGSSNISNAAPSAYTPANPSALDSFNVEDGALYPATDGLYGCVSVGANVGNALLRLADGLVTDGKFDRVVIAAMGIGSADSAVWATGFAATRVSVALARLRARGIVEGPNVTIVVIIGEGEADGGESMATPTYTANMNTWFASMRATGFQGRIFVRRQTYFFGVPSPTIKAAQTALVNHDANVWVGADADSLVGNVCGGSACRQAAPDSTHWTDAGSASIAVADRAALAASGAPF